MNFKDAVGNAIFSFVESIIGARADKVTGMLVAMSIDEIRAFMQDWNVF